MTFLPAEMPGPCISTPGSVSGSYPRGRMGDAIVRRPRVRGARSSLARRSASRRTGRFLPELTQVWHCTDVREWVREPTFAGQVVAITQRHGAGATRRHAPRSLRVLPRVSPG